MEVKIKMSLTETLKTEETNAREIGVVEEIYSPKLGKYVPLSSKESVGEIQKYNIGLAPGSWY